jgi:hypothetical protein
VLGAASPSLHAWREHQLVEVLVEAQPRRRALA